MTTLLTVRDDLAAAIRPAVTDAVNVYPYPAEVVALPCVVIVPASPWWTPDAFGQSVMARVRCYLELHIIVPRTEVETAFADLETIAVAVGSVLSTSPVFRWVDLTGVEPVEVGTIPALLARAGVQAKV